MSYKLFRQIKGIIMLSLSFFATVLGIGLLFTILYCVMKSGLSGLSLALFTEDSAPAWLEGEGGLRHAFIGQIILTACASVIGIPIGILGGIYLAEYGNNNKIAKFISAVADVSISIPTIIIGTFIYTLLVKPFGGFSGWAGACSLAVILIPIVMRVTEESLRLIPDTLREAALALGAPYYKVIKDVIIKSVLTGIFTGVSLAISRIAGETAPLLFTSFNYNYLSFNMSEPMPSLTVTIFQYAGSPYDSWIASAWASSLVVTVFILITNIILKGIIGKRKV